MPFTYTKIIYLYSIIFKSSEKSILFIDMVRNSLKEFSNFPGFPFPCYFRRGEEGGKGKEGGKGERGIEERETGRKRVKGRVGVMNI